MNIKNILIVTICSIISLISKATPSLFIENYYGSPITCMINNNQQLIIQSNGMPTYLGTIQSKGQKPIPGDVISLSIWTNYSPKATYLEQLLAQVSQDSLQNSGKNAVLIIKSSGYLSNWDIKPVWRNPNATSTSFSMKSPESSIEKSNQKDEQTYERQLQKDKITPKQYLEFFEKYYNKNDTYERDCFEKLEILRLLNYEQIAKKHSDNRNIYSKLTSFGYPELLNILASISFNYGNYLSYPNSPSLQHGNLSASQVRTYMKKAIQEQFQLYLQYKKNGWLD